MEASTDSNELPHKIGGDNMTLTYSHWRAAQYLRMSTEHQQYSIANQSAAIALYAAAHNIGIVRSFVDPGKSGTTIKRRKGLQELLRVVESGAADFDHVLVYDVSRWGRFPDCDEAAHYEFVCKQAGIAVLYCAEQFENDNSATSNLLKALKRTMAGEYSRELSVKVSAGQRRLAGMGFWQGGYAPFGYVRQLVSEFGERKEVLQNGEWKSINTDRVTLVPGPQQAIDTIQLAFDLYTKDRKSRRRIAETLNEQHKLLNGRAWNGVMLANLFRNPVYKGAYAYGKHEARNRAKTVPREQWLVREHAFPAIISEKQWARARDRVMTEISPLVNSEMLDCLRRLWKRKGRLSTAIIESAKDVPSPIAYRNHFGSLNEAYKLIGHAYNREYSYLHAKAMARKTRDALCDDICELIRAVGGMAKRQPGLGMILVNGNVTVQVSLSSACQWRTGLPVWRLNMGKQPTADILIIGRLCPPNRSISDYFVMPAWSQLHGALHVRKATIPPFLDPYYFVTLEQIIQTFCCYRMSEAA